MSTEARSEYLKLMRMRYLKAKTSGDKKLMPALLNEVVEITGLHRKYLTNVLNGRRRVGSGRRGKKPIYRLDKLRPFIKEFYFAMEQPGADKLRAGLVVWLPFLESKELTPDLRAELLKLSVSTIERVLKSIRANVSRGLAGTRRSNLLKNVIPLQTKSWDQAKPGFMETDTVHHCGNTLQGDYGLTLTMTDIASTWTENRAMFGKSHGEVVKAAKSIEDSLPFPLLGVDSDNGCEWNGPRSNGHFGVNRQCLSVL